jgi:hypothetical protein
MSVYLFTASVAIEFKLEETSQLEKIQEEIITDSRSAHAPALPLAVTARFQ